MEQAKKYAIPLTALTLLLGYGLYKYLLKGGPKKLESSLSGDDLLMHHLLEDIKKLGTVQLNDQFVVPFEQFIDIYKIIRHHAKIKISRHSEDFKHRRRALLGGGEDLSPEYKQIVLAQTQMEQDCYEQVSTVVLDEIGVTQEQFQQTQEVYMTQPAMQSRFFASIQQNAIAQTAQFEATGSKLLAERERVKEMFLYSEQVKMESMRAL